MRKHRGKIRRHNCKGCAMGGVARALKLSPERRAEIAYVAAITRWSKRHLRKHGYPHPAKTYAEAVAEAERDNPSVAGPNSPLL